MEFWPPTNKIMTYVLLCKSDSVPEFVELKVHLEFFIKSHEIVCSFATMYQYVHNMSINVLVPNMKTPIAVITEWFSSLYSVMKD